jgi:DNA mismatch repair protein MutS
MMKQYTTIKSRYPDAILMFRLGDFYEMFGEDAETASRILEITLTSREAGRGNRIPMCGIPHHAAHAYIGRLIEAGYKVAICEQMEPPRPGRKVVRREVVRVITPGTILEPEFLEEKKNNYLIALAAQGKSVGLALLDVSTGEFAITEARGEQAEETILTEISNLSAKECVVTPSIAGDLSLLERLRSLSGLTMTFVDDRAQPAISDFQEGPVFRTSGSQAALAKKALTDHFGSLSLEAAGCMEYPLGMQAAGVLLLYVSHTQMTSLSYITKVRCYSIGDSMAIDPETRRSLELTDTIRPTQRGKEHTLFRVMDRTVTSMGGRLLRKWMDHPSRDLAEINRRLDAVEELEGDVIRRNDIRRVLSRILDLERLAARIGTGGANARDLVALAESLKVIPELKGILDGTTSDALKELALGLLDLSQLTDLIGSAIVDDPPHVLTEGGIIRKGYNEELDKLSDTSRRSREFLASLEVSEKEKTGIKSLKVGYNQVFGYYFEVTRPNLHLVPESWIRKQTLAGAERFITPELKEHETIILKAKERMATLEYELFSEVRDKVACEIPKIQQVAEAVAELDVFASFAESANLYGYVRPDLDEGFDLDITGARHPVVEQSLPQGVFIPNDIRLDSESCQVMVLTGPNMSGKSTLGKTALLITLMAHMGSFVPATSARIPLTDRIAVRAGSSEEIAEGKSTFLVELLQTSIIISQATERTLIFIDELGRGTSTYDGMAIAQAVIEYIHDKIGAKTIFTTHFHELAALEDKLDRVKNFRIEAEERGGEVVFLYKLSPGGCDRSYGINVAKMAGMPRDLIRRANAILTELERRSPSRPQQMSLLAVLMDGQGTLSPPSDHDGIIEEIKKMDIDSMTPLEALTRLSDLKSKIEGKENL